MRFALAGAVLFAATAACGQVPKDTEQWTPIPEIVTAKAAAPPSDAIVLFDGKDLESWVSTRTKGSAGWTVENGVMTVAKLTGNIETRQHFRNYQLHLEYRIPAGITGAGQARGNSGVFLATTGPGDGGYELQILDSYRNETYVNGQAGSIYKQRPPLVNASRPPGEWQTYDVVWTAPVFADGKLVSPARLTALHNGVLIQNDAVLTGETLYIGKPSYHRPHGASPIRLQAHGDPSPPISFRNIWLRELR